VFDKAVYHLLISLFSLEIFAVKLESYRIGKVSWSYSLWLQRSFVWYATF